jgi:Zn-dependent protease
MFGSYHITTVRGVPIKIHVLTILIMLLIIGGDILSGLLFIAALLFSVALHELGHTVVSQRYGIQVQDIILTPIGGGARLKSLPENPRHEIRIALAGPYVSFALAVVGYALSMIFQILGLGPVAIFLWWFSVLNLILGVFNLLPSFPMDGGRILRGWLTQRKGALEATRIASQLGKYMAGVFIVYGIVTNTFNLIFIGLFILMAANSEYKMMQVKTWQEQQFGGNAMGGGAEFVASPPPYAKKKTPAPDGLFGDMLITVQDLITETCRSCFPKK